MFKIKALVGALALLAMAACSSDLEVYDLDRPDLNQFDGSAEQLARQTLTALQPHSTATNLEYCGSIVEREDGTKYVTGPFKGDSDSCGFPEFYEVEGYTSGDEELADYHTHSSYGEDIDSEVPSATDIESNSDWGIPGYVSTPGGRFWYVSGSNYSARQICGLSCLPSDPNFVEEFYVPQSLTLDDLEDR